MIDWNEDNFLEKLTPKLRQKSGGAIDPCPDAETLCAVIEGEARGPERDAVIEHLSQCASCAELRSRLLNFENFDSVSPPEPEAVWKQTRTRLDNWLEGFLRSEAAQSRSSKGGKPSRRVSAWESLSNLFTPRKIVWALGVAAALVLIVDGVLLLEYKRAQLHQMQVAARATVPPQAPAVPTPVEKPPVKSTEKPRITPHEEGLPKAGKNLPSRAGSTIRPNGRVVRVPLAPALSAAPADRNLPSQITEGTPPLPLNAGLPSAPPGHNLPPEAAQATVPPPPTLKGQLEAQYKLAKLALNSGQIAVTEPGTVLVIQQAGILGVPLSDLAMAPVVYKDGVLHPPSKKSSFGASLLQSTTRPSSETSGKDFRPLPVGVKVYVSKIDVNMKNDRIGFVIVECGECNGASELSPYKAAVSFQFPKGYLETANLPDVEDTIARVIPVDTATAVAQAAQRGPQRNGASAAAIGHPATLRLDPAGRLLIVLSSISPKPDGSFQFHGTLLLPFAQPGSAPLDRGAEVIGAGTTSQGQTSLAVTDLVIQGVRYTLKDGSGVMNAQTPGAGGGVHLDRSQVLEMWPTAIAVYEKVSDPIEPPESRK
ncbi:MAG: hypothetical protein WB763_00745 [Terriglobia bacterium]|jgi:hypothetical protein